LNLIPLLYSTKDLDSLETCFNSIRLDGMYTD
jgi:hypothetical protein